MATTASSADQPRRMTASPDHSQSYEASGVFFAISTLPPAASPTSLQAAAASFPEPPNLSAARRKSVGHDSPLSLSSKGVPLGAVQRSDWRTKRSCCQAAFLEIRQPFTSRHIARHLVQHASSERREG